MIGQYLVEAGRAQWTLSWTGPSRLIAADITAEELRDLLAAAVTRPATEVSRLRLHLAALRLDTAAEPNPWKADTGASTDAGAIGGTGGARMRGESVVDIPALERRLAVRVRTVLMTVTCVVIALLIRNH
jgi:hypothetical protein